MTAKLPITAENIRDWFPAPATENPLAGDPWWQLQGIGLFTAIQLARLIPPGDIQQQALIELRRALDTALLALTPPNDEEIQRRMAQTLAPWCPSPWPVVDAMLDLANLKTDDFLIDLGSGDGRIVLEASRRGACALGIDIDHTFVAQSIERVTESPAYCNASFRQGDIHDADLSHATVITCYLLSGSMRVLKEKFRALRSGTRIISHAFPMEGWTPTKTIMVAGTPVYLWVV